MEDLFPPSLQDGNGVLFFVEKTPAPFRRLGVYIVQTV
jgi:hypothetical protein